MVEKIIKNLRTEIRKLEEDELFEQTILRGSQVGLETRPSTNDIDVLMKSMMNLDMSLSEGSTGKIVGRVMDETLLDGPWNIQIPNQSMSYEGNPGAAEIECFGRHDYLDRWEEKPEREVSQTRVNEVRKFYIETR